MTDRRPDPRYVDSDDPRAVLRAWGGEDRASAVLDMGGWLDADREAFEAAVQAESLRAAGAALGCVVIEVVSRLTASPPIVAPARSCAADSRA